MGDDRILTSLSYLCLFDGSNYGVWSQIVKMYITANGKLGYINGELDPPPSTDPTFRKWRTENAIVKGWLINFMEPAFIGSVIRLPTAKQVWDSLATTYFDWSMETEKTVKAETEAEIYTDVSMSSAATSDFDGSDTKHVYELRRRVSRHRQVGGSIEKYYAVLLALWQEIDFRRPNPMKCAVDIQKYNDLLEEERVYTFLNGLDDRLDNVRCDVLQLRPFPTVEQAFAQVRRETLRQMIMNDGNQNYSYGAVHAFKGLKFGPKRRDSIKGLKCNHILLIV